jgi:hypothetical protein
VGASFFAEKEVGGGRGLRKEANGRVNKCKNPQ